MPSSRASSQPRDRTYISCNSCITSVFFTTQPQGGLIYTLEIGKSYQWGLDLLFPRSSRFKKVLEKMLIMQIKLKSMSRLWYKKLKKHCSSIQKLWHGLSKYLFTLMMSGWSYNMHLCCFTCISLVDINKIINNIYVRTVLIHPLQP